MGAKTEEMGAEAEDCTLEPPYEDINIRNTEEAV